MEYQILDEKSIKENSISSNKEGIFYLNRARKWALLIAVINLVGVGILFLPSILYLVAGITDVINSTGMLIGGLIIIGFIGVFIIPVIYLLKFTRSASLACQKQDGDSLTQTFKNLGLHFKSIGIILLVITGTYLLIFFGFLILGARLASLLTLLK